MFGLALRSYQLKLQRLQESASEAGVTLWSAVRSFIEQRGAVARLDIVRRFARDDEATVRGILSDLVESGLVYRTGRGDATIYRVTPRDDLVDLAESDSADARPALVWLTVCREGPMAALAIAEATRIPIEQLETVLDALVADARVQRIVEEQEVLFSAQRCLIPVGDEAGWEAALLDHYQAVLNAIAAKVTAGAKRSAPADQTGGATYTFELWPGHPHELTVRGLLARLRAEAAGTWDEVSTYNAANHGSERGRFNVTFYLGQYLRSEDEE
jgi:hypothetical protein